jgi:hypothetical protein
MIFWVVTLCHPLGGTYHLHILGEFSQDQDVRHLYGWRTASGNGEKRKRGNMGIEVMKSAMHVYALIRVVL